jgi:hypothetical protein
VPASWLSRSFRRGNSENHFQVLLDVGLSSRM